MATDRRTFLLAIATVAAAPLAARALHRWAPVASSAAPALRPDASGSSAAVCARCGTPGHTFLDRHCPEAAGDHVALVAAARRGSRAGVTEVLS